MEIQITPIDPADLLNDYEALSESRFDDLSQDEQRVAEINSQIIEKREKLLLGEEIQIYVPIPIANGANQLCNEFKEKGWLVSSRPDFVKADSYVAPSTWLIFKLSDDQLSSLQSGHK